MRDAAGAQPGHPARPPAGAQRRFFPIRSQVLGRTFHIYVRLPESYAAEPARRCPIVYLLDGDSMFPVLAVQQLFLTYDEEQLPEAITVGIAYGSFEPGVNRRTIDLTRPAPGVGPSAAGAPFFQRFLKEELLPAVERRYRADARRRILFGQSRGGTLFLFSAFTDPDLFWARIASNPVIQIARDLFFGTPAAASRRGLHLIVASGSRHRANLREDALAWFQTWQGRSGLPWRLHTMTIDGGTHAANSPDVYRASRRGLFGETGSGAR